MSHLETFECNVWRYVGQCYVRITLTWLFWKNSFVVLILQRLVGEVHDLLEIAYTHRHRARDDIGRWKAKGQKVPKNSYSIKNRTALDIYKAVFRIVRSNWQK